MVAGIVVRADLYGSRIGQGGLRLDYRKTVLLRKGFPTELHDRLLSVKKGERRTLNFIIRTCEGEQGSCVRLSISCEDWNWAGNLNATPNYYYEDKGVLTTPEVYEMVWEGLQNKLQQSDE